MARVPVCQSVCRFCGACVQAKDGGRKVVAVVSSSEASVSPVAAGARNADAPLGPFDVMLPSYRASKAALNRCECPVALTSYPALLQGAGTTFPPTHRRSSRFRLRGSPEHY
jgi:hypothetical protein